MRRFAVTTQSVLQALTCMTVLLWTASAGAQEQSSPPSSSDSESKLPPLQGTPEPGQKAPAASHEGQTGAPEEPVRSQVKPRDGEADAQAPPNGETDDQWLDRTQR